MSLLTDLVAFFEEHRRCGELDGGVEDGRVRMTCNCGAALTQPLPLRGLIASLPPTPPSQQDA